MHIGLSPHCSIDFALHFSSPQLTQLIFKFDNSLQTFNLPFLPTLCKQLKVHFSFGISILSAHDDASSLFASLSYSIFDDDGHALSNPRGQNPK